MIAWIIRWMRTFRERKLKWLNDTTFIVTDINWIDADISIVSSYMRWARDMIGPLTFIIELSISYLVLSLVNLLCVVHESLSLVNIWNNGKFILTIIFDWGCVRKSNIDFILQSITKVLYDFLWNFDRKSTSKMNGFQQIIILFVLSRFRLHYSEVSFVYFLVILVE
jgi:hypothetical protein